MSDTDTLARPGFAVSANAARRIALLMQSEGHHGLFFRIAVAGGGCSGFQYTMAFDDRRNADDLAYARDGITVLVDETSLALLAGSELDFVEEMIGASFQVRNPNAASSCGCGNSFSV